MKKINYPRNIEKLYLHIFSKKELQEMNKAWKVAISKFNKLSLIAPDIEYILKADFKQLTDIYFQYKEIENNDPTIKQYFIRKNGTKTVIHLFDYNKYYPKIINFFCKNAYAMDIFACFYCDIHPIGKYAKKINEPRLTVDLDHFYPKDQCPLLALSLKNFVPSCQVCNSRMKGKTNFLKFYGLDKITDIPTLKQILVKLSPTSDQYNFNKYSRIVVKPVPGFTETKNFLKNIHCYKIKFNTNSIYQHETKALLLEQRYNSITILSEALSILDLKQRYPRIKIKKMKQLLNNCNYKITEEDIEEIIFRKKYDENRHSNLLKLKNDILK